MADEYFFALTLKGAKASQVWDPESKGVDEYQGGHKLIIKQAVLGPEATEGEVTVLQVETTTWPMKNKVKTPVAVLKAGGATNQVLLDLSFPDPPVTFSLAQGSGPVHIIGHHLIGSPIEEYDEMDEMEEEMLDEEEGEEDAELNPKKRSLSTIQEVEEEDEEDEDGPKSKKAKTTNSSSTKGKTPVKNNKAKK